MKKLMAIVMALSLLFALPAMADRGTAEVVMEGKTYHLTLNSVGIVDGQLNVVIEGFGSTLRMGADGMMVAGLPEAHYGDEIVQHATMNALVGGPFTFVFQRDDMPDSIWMKSYDEGVEPALIWQAEEDDGDPEAGDGADGEAAPDGPVGTDPSWQVGDVVIFGRYEQDNDLSNGPEPIEWIVLESEADARLLISKYGLDARAYHESEGDITWETCTLRRWLNEDFLHQAFTAEEQGLMLDALRENPDNEAFGTVGGNETRDRLFLLSIDETNRCFPTQEDRPTAPTDYAKGNGAYVNDNGNGWWWLRSPGKNQGYAAVVNSKGFSGGSFSDLDVAYTGEDVSTTNNCVRPALWMFPDTESGAGSGHVGADEPTDGRAPAQTGGYARDDAGDGVVWGDGEAVFDLNLFTAEYDNWELLTASTDMPMPANGCMLLLRFRSRDAYPKEEYEQRFAPAMRLRAMSDGTELEPMEVITPDDEETEVFDLLYYSPDYRTMDEFELLCEGVLYPLSGLPRDGSPLPKPTPTPTPEPTPAPTPEPEHIAALNELYRRAKADKSGGSMGVDAFGGDLVIAIYRHENSEMPEVLTKGGESSYDFPRAYLADSWETADRAAIIFPTHEVVGFYSTGGTARNTTTWVTLFDLHSGLQYKAINKGTDSPPHTISVPVINGVTMPGSGEGMFMIQRALDEIAERAETARSAPTPKPTPEPTPEPTAEPEEIPNRTPTEERAPDPAGAIPVDEVLDALGDQTFRAVYDALRAGETIQKGSKGDTAKGLQQTLVAFGQKISVDGSVGPKTIAALNAVQAIFGLEQTESLDAAGYAALLPRLLCITDPEEAEALFSHRMDSAEYDYIRACAYVAQGLYYQGKNAFLDSEWGDWKERAAECVQPWPKTGVLYENPEVAGSCTELTVQFKNDPEKAKLVKIYTAEGVLARTMFIGGTGKAKTSLPAGRYLIKDGTGTKWYGEADAFGEEGYYEIITFQDGVQEIELKSGYQHTITVNVEDSDPNADNLGSERENWMDF